MGLTEILNLAVVVSIGIVAVVSIQFKMLKHIFIGAIVMNTLTVVSYILEGGISGAGMCFLAVSQTSVALLFACRDKKMPNWLNIMFVGLYCGLAVISYHQWFDLFSGTAAVLYALAVLQTKSWAYRWITLANCLCWVAYDMLVGAHLILVIHIFYTLSTAVSIIRERRTTKNKII